MNLLNATLAKVIISGFFVYRIVLGPVFYFLGARCRFTPTCSHYAEQAILKHGFFKGTFMGGSRLLRCHPLCAGGYDPVEE